LAVNNVVSVIYTGDLPKLLPSAEPMVCRLFAGGERIQILLEDIGFCVRVFPGA
jgi:hypothetical protein